MFLNKSFIYTSSLISFFGLLTVSTPAYSQASYDPTTSATFLQATKGMSAIHNYTFGTAYGRTVPNLSQLAASFSPYGIAGHTVIQNEWERYQEFNSSNFVFTDTALNLTATIPSGGGLFSGGIHSGQICTKQTYQPDVTGYSIYAFEVRMKIPDGVGTWPAAWFYTQQPGHNDSSEIDNPEFWVMQNQNQFDWTGFQHGPGQGNQIYSIKNNQWVWHPGINFSADYHDYQTVWTPDAVYKYFDGTLVYAQQFKWTSPGTAQLIVNLAVGSGNLPGLQPNSLSEFPAMLSVEHISVWAK